MACTTDVCVAELKMPKGDHRTFELTVKDQNQLPVDLTGSVIVFTLKQDPTDPIPLIQKSSANPGEIDLTNPTGGVVRINLVPGDTSGLDPDVYQFDIVVTTPASKVHTVTIGTLELQQDVTN